MTPSTASRGFSLIELLMVVMAIAILAAIAVPSYTEYVTRSKIQEATSLLSEWRVAMEQFYFDNRRYNTTGGAACGAVPPGTVSKHFAITCTTSTPDAGNANQAYVITATGDSTAGMGGFSFTIDDLNVKKTTGVGSGWTLPSSDCWVQKKGGQC